MAGADRLDGGTGTPVVSQRSDSGQGILAAKEGRGKYDVLYNVVCKAVMSFMSAGCSWAVLRDTPPCLAITAILDCLPQPGAGLACRHWMSWSKVASGKKEKKSETICNLSKDGQFHLRIRVHREPHRQPHKKMQPPPLSQSQQLAYGRPREQPRERPLSASGTHPPSTSIPERLADRSSDDERYRRISITPRGLKGGIGRMAEAAGYLASSNGKLGTLDRRTDALSAVPGPYLSSTPRSSAPSSVPVSKEDVNRRRQRVMFDSDDEDSPVPPNASQGGERKKEYGPAPLQYPDNERENEQSRERNRDREDNAYRVREREREMARPLSRERVGRDWDRGGRDGDRDTPSIYDSRRKMSKEDEVLHHHAREPPDVQSARENRGLRPWGSWDRGEGDRKVPLYEPRSSTRGRSASPAIRQVGSVGVSRRKKDQVSDTDSDLDDIAARHATNFLAQSSSPPPAPKTGSRTMWPPRQKSSITPRQVMSSSPSAQDRDRDMDRSISHRNSPPTVVYPEVRDLHEKTKDLHDEVRTLRQYMMDLERANNARVQSLEKARDRSEDEIRTLQKARDRAEDEIRNLRSIVGDSEKARLRAEDEVHSLRILVDAIQSQLDDLNHGQQWLEEKQKKQEQELNQSIRSSPNNSHAQLAHPADLSHTSGLGTRHMRVKGAHSPRTTAVISADVVLDDGTRHLPFQAESESDRDKQQSEILGIDRSFERFKLQDLDRRKPPLSAGSLPTGGGVRKIRIPSDDAIAPVRDTLGTVERDPLLNTQPFGMRPRQDPGLRSAREASREPSRSPPRRSDSPSRIQMQSIVSPQPTETMTTIKTPTLKHQSGRQHKVVIVQRQPIPGTQVEPDDKVGIGISFGMTAKGDVFITGMAPNGPAKTSGHIRRGDQLVAVDGTEISSWDVKDIVDLIIGPQGSFVRLEIATLPENEFSPSPTGK